MDQRKPRVIVGLGSTGLACAHYFAHHGIPFSVVDANSKPPLLRELQHEFPLVEFQSLNEKVFLPTEEIVLSPGVPLKSAEIQKAISEGVNVTGDIEIFSKVVTKPFVAITGSNGKTTVTRLLGEMAEKCHKPVQLAGNIGIPSLSVVDAEVDFFVLEVSSYQLEVVERLAADVAVVLNLTPDHLDRYAGVQDYYDAKLKVFTGCGLAVTNRDMDCKLNIQQGVPVVSFGIDEPHKDTDFGYEHSDGKTYLVRGTQRLLDVDQFGLIGRHNRLNVAAAVAIGYEIGFNLDGMIEAIQSFKGLPHRCELVGSYDGVTYINDSKATNPASSIAAVTGMSDDSDDIVLILGGDAKDADFSAFEAACEDQVRLYFIYGKDSQMISDSISGNKRICKTLAEVVGQLREYVRAGDKVLLSPGCASLDQFSNYEERGDEFKRLLEAVSQ
jgi:UDP-N-acetylmuramoylalanine--D-glutamate ligase